MKNKTLFNKTLLYVGVIFIIVTSILFVLGSINREGYLSNLSINADNTLKLNNIDVENTKKLFSSDNKLDYSSLTNYIFTNSNISKYSYNFRISYYSKVFGNSDIYGVYLNTNSLPDYISDVKFQEKGSPFGILISSKIIEQEKIDNIEYSLYIKFFNLLIYLILFYIFIILLYVFRKILLNIIYYIFFLLRKDRKLLLIYLIIYVSLIFFLFILGNLNREGYLSNLSINADNTLKLNNIDVENTKKLFSSNNKLDYSSLTNYIFTNSNISKYSYNFRISYYSKIFGNSDIYGVYLNTNSLPDYIEEIKMNNNFGTPFGNLVSLEKLKEKKIDDIYYKLKLKFNFLSILFLSCILLIIFIYELKNIILKFLNFLLCKIININRYVYILFIFLCFLIMPNIMYFLFGNYFDKTNYENRLKAQKPTLSINNVSKYPNEYEKYFNDYIPFRSEIIKLKNLIDLFVFRNFISDKTLLGKNKWLFFKRDNKIDNTIENYIGIKNFYFSDMELEICKNNLLNFRDELKKRNIDFILMICPDKEFIYTNYMPNYVKRKTNINSTDEFVKYMIKNTDIKIVYPKDELIKYKDKYQLYYRYDHHWNALGGYIAYSKLMKLFSINVRNLESLNILSFDYKYRNSWLHYSQTANYVALSSLEYFKDDKIFVISNFISKKTNIMINNLMSWGINYYYTNKYSMNTNNIYIIRDSMAQELLDYIFPSFNETSVISVNKFDIVDIVDKKPNVIIFETIERFLKSRLLNVLPNYKIEEINKDLKTNFIEVNN
ncbi:alginate O-acetyltransferase AlgX-related protein [Brachyspira sp. SAP_772]|uniref:alginate O-acetyltransferase AlgX-related protein n=1 Tax=Brachyspira sp. SAP_772 TaxID=2608385 RepID=UPI0012F48B1B|nr:hypothetical protein [Brachyspira sp. SAP_772]